jgi:curved DNA-binding protein
MSVRDARTVLGLAEGDDPRRLRDAYLAAVKASHPDKPGGDAERLRCVVEAYALLKSAPAAPTNPLPTRPAKPTSRTLALTPDEAMLGGERSVPLERFGSVVVRLPPGLRVGDMVAVSGVAMTVAINAGEGAAIVGDHLCLTVRVDRAFLAVGGDLEVATPAGPLKLRVSRQDALRGIVRHPGGGLPARAGHAQGDLLVRLTAAASPSAESRAQVLLRRFVASWAA